MDLEYKSLKELLAGKAAGAFAVSPETTVHDALRLMAEKNTGFLVVTAGEKLVGVFSERDYARKGELRGRVAKNTRVREVMTEQVYCVSLKESVPHCMAIMNEKGFRHLPVVEDGRLMGVLSNRDLMKEVLSHHEHLIRDLNTERMQSIDSRGAMY